MPEAPGPTPDRAAAELTEAELMLAERMLRDLPHGKVISTAELIPLVAAVLAELDRQRALIAAVLAECDEAEARAPHIVGGRLPAILPVAEIRDLLEGEGR